MYLVLYSSLLGFKPQWMWLLVFAQPVWQFCGGCCCSIKGQQQLAVLLRRGCFFCACAWDIGSIMHHLHQGVGNGNAALMEVEAVPRQNGFVCSCECLGDAVFRFAEQACFAGPSKQRKKGEDKVVMG
jgi:hypothetical protein